MFSLGSFKTFLTCHSYSTFSTKLIQKIRHQALPMTQMKPSKARKKGKAAKTPKQPLEREWQRIVNLKKRNERLEQELTAFKQECINALREDEQQMADAILQQSRHLSQFLSRKSLAQWHKIELLEWIHENLTQVASSPFCDADQLAKITHFLQDLQQSLGLIIPEPEPGPGSRSNGPEQEQKQQRKNQRADSATPDMFEDLFADFEHKAEEENESDKLFEDNEDPDFWEHIFEESRHAEEEANQERRDQTRSLQQLLKKSSINTLFRRLARLLHPDREQDESLKAQRHEQMSELIQAREHNDLFTLFNLYQEHTGEFPLDSLSGDSGQVLDLLKAHTQELREQQETLIYADPLCGQFYDRFYDKNSKMRERKLRQYCTELRGIIANERQITRSIHSIATLKPYLEDRFSTIPPIDFL